MRVAGAPEARRRALRGLAASLAARGAHRKAVRILEALVGIAGAGAGPALLTELGLAQLAARNTEAAREVLERALAADPDNLAAAIPLVRTLGELGQGRAVERLAARFDPGPLASHAAAAWHAAVGDAWRALGHVEAAEAALRRAIALDPAALAPAEAWLALALAAADDPAIDAALSSVRTRALLAGDDARSALVAAALVARGAASDDERVAALADRAGGLAGAPAALPPGWLRSHLGYVAPVLPEAPVPGTGEVPRGEDWMLALAEAMVPGVRPAIEWSASERVEVERDPSPVVRLPRSAGRGLEARFALGRALAALVEPALAPGLEPADGQEAGVASVLDRAGLVASRDPLSALAMLGPFTARGRALTRFVVAPSTAAWLRPASAPRIRPLPNGVSEA